MGKLIARFISPGTRRFGRQRLLYSFFALSIALCAAGCEKRVKESKFLMSTIVEITAIGSEGKCQKAEREAFKEIGRIDKLMNAYDEDSEVSKINKSAGESPVAVSPDTLEVIDQALSLAHLTDGALDITVAPLMDLWNFGSETAKQVPSDSELNEKLALVDYRKVSVNEDNTTVMLESPGMKIDVSGIAKGYAVDMASHKLQEQGIKNALVNAGGDIYAMGSPPGKKSWKVGIRHPRIGNGLLGVLELKDAAVATSGDYENFFEVDGKRYCHIMDTKTGRPVQGIMSVTVIADTAAEADALATAIFPLGAEKGMQLIENMEGVECLIVTGEGENDLKTHVSSGMKSKFHLILD